VTLRLTRSPGVFVSREPYPIDSRKQIKLIDIFPISSEPRNNARVIPDGVFQAVHMVRVSIGWNNTSTLTQRLITYFSSFVQTPLYVQIQGWGDFTKLNIANGDYGGEL
jgi:hypothetical protein